MGQSVAAEWTRDGRALSWQHTFYAVPHDDAAHAQGGRRRWLPHAQGGGGGATPRDRGAAVDGGADGACAATEPGVQLPLTSTSFHACRCMRAAYAAWTCWSWRLSRSL